MSDGHLVAYVGGIIGTRRAWRCQHCWGVWDFWAEITGPCVPVGLAHEELDESVEAIG